MKKLTSIAVILALLVAGCGLEAKNNKESRFGKKSSLFAADKKDEKPKVSVSTLPNTVDIHYSAKYCTECHVSSPRQGSHSQLRYEGDLKILCRCHYNTSNNYIHPVDRRPSEEMIDRIPAQYPLQAGQITCSTCHDIFIQCQDNQLERSFLKEQKFLRGQPFSNESSICYRCHDIESYQMYNPHQQTNANKEIIKEKCLYCHSEIPDEKQTTAKDAKLIGHLEPLCIRCHKKVPGQDFHAKHRRKPSKEILTRINQLEARQNIILPLSEEGKLTCATCHNPHEKGVIPDVRAGATGAGGEKRHRLENKMCIKCHPMR